MAGVDKDSLERSSTASTGSLVDHTVRVGSTRVAELTKLLENTFRHVNIALVNELATHAHELDVDLWQAIDAAETKPFGFLAFRPGPGVGGHCLPVDPSYLSWEVRRAAGQPLRLVELANEINSRMPDYVVSRLAAAMNERGQPISGRRFLVLGLSYKRNSGDTRHAPAVQIARRLHSLGGLVRAVDPLAPDRATPEGVARTELTAAELTEADAVVLLVDHDAFDYGLVEDASTFVFDCTRRLGPYANVEVL